MSVQASSQEIRTQETMINDAYQGHEDVQTDDLRKVDLALEAIHPNFGRDVSLQTEVAEQLQFDLPPQVSHKDRVAQIKRDAGLPGKTPDGTKRRGPTDTEVYVASSMGVSPRKLPYIR
jgi:hypothetical protein